MLTAGGGPDITVHGWASWLIIAGSVVVAAGAIWKAIWPIVRAAVKVNEALPTLVQIGEDFRRDHGSSLRDRIDNIDDNVDALGTVTIEEDGRLVEKPVVVVLAELYDYAHKNNHMLKGRIETAEAWRETVNLALAAHPPEGPEPPT